MKFHRTPLQNNENHENSMISRQNNKNHEIPIIQRQNNENHCNLVIPRQSLEINEIYKISQQKN